MSQSQRVFLRITRSSWGVGAKYLTQDIIKHNIFDAQLFVYALWNQNSWNVCAWNGFCIFQSNVWNVFLRMLENTWANFAWRSDAINLKCYNATHLWRISGNIPSQMSMSQFSWPSRWGPISDSRGRSLSVWRNIFDSLGSSSSSWFNFKDMI